MLLSVPDQLMIRPLAVFLPLAPPRLRGCLLTQQMCCLAVLCTQVSVAESNGGKASGGNSRHNK